MKHVTHATRYVFIEETTLNYRNYVKSHRGAATLKFVMGFSGNVGLPATVTTSKRSFAVLMRRSRIS